MKKFPKTIEEFLKQTSSDITVPPRDTFYSIMNSVTDLSTNRNTMRENDKKLSFHQYFMQSTNKWLSLGVVTLGIIALVFIVNYSPKQGTDSSLITSTEEATLVAEADSLNVSLPSASSDSAIDLAVREILLDGIEDYSYAEEDTYDYTDESDSAFDEFITS